MFKQIFRDFILATQAWLARGKSKRPLSGDWRVDELSRYEAEDRLKGGFYQ